MHVFRPSILPATTEGSWPKALILIGAFVVWLVVWYWDTVLSMASTWYRSVTFTHGFLVFPIAGWLVWRMRRELAALVPGLSTSWLPALAMLAAALLWLAGDLADVLAARQFAWVTLLIAGIWWIVGNDVARRLAFPLAFLYFAVPIGEFLIPTMIEWTADFTVAALRVSGVPVLREGMTFQIPTGSWSVVEACSGLRYLIASAMVGVLYAYLSYRSLSRRLVFVAASLVVPIVANWLRAYMIVMIGHLSDNRLAVGVDHFIYGWVFFGVVIFLLFWVGSFWREDTPVDQMPHAMAALRGHSPAPRAYWHFAIISALTITAAAPATVMLFHSQEMTGSIEASAPPLGDWRPNPASLHPWTPQFTPPRTVIASTYERAGKRAGVYVAIYYDQNAGSKLVSSENQLLRAVDRTSYAISEARRVIDTEKGALSFDESLLRVPDGRILVRSWFWIDGVSTASRVRAKLAQAYGRLKGRGDAGAIVVVYTLLPVEGRIESSGLDDLTRQTAAALPEVLSSRLRAGDPG
jgi:exosortase A